MISCTAVHVMLQEDAFKRLFYLNTNRLGNKYSTCEYINHDFKECISK